MEDNNDLTGQFGQAPEISDGDVDAALQRLNGRASRYEKRRNAIFAAAMVAIVSVGALSAYAISNQDDNKVTPAASSTTSSIGEASSTTSTTQALRLLSSYRLTFDGFGPLQIGSNLAETKANNPDIAIQIKDHSLGLPCQYTAKQGSTTVDLDYRSPTGNEDTIQAVTVYMAGIQTDRGIGVGSSFSEVQSKYPEALDIDRDGSSLLANSDSSTPSMDQPGKRQILFVFAEGKVQFMAVGYRASCD